MSKFNSAILIAAWLIFPGLVQASIVPSVVIQESILSPGNAVQMRYSHQYGLLFLRNSASAIHVIDVNTGVPIDLHLANERFTDIDISPDGRYLFAADFGGEQTGYGNPLRPSYVQRYDMVTRTWESRTAPRIAYRIEAVSSDRVLLLESDQWVDVTLNQWNSSSMTELSRRAADYYGDMEYHPATGRMLHGNSGSSSREINAFRIVSNSIISAESSGTYGSAQNGGGTSVLSTDGQRFYYGRLQVEALDVTNNIRMFPEAIYSATGEVAFGQNNYFSAVTGMNLGTLGYSATALAPSDDGRHLWVFRQSDNTLNRYLIVPEPSSLLILCFGALAVTNRRRGRMIVHKAGQ